MTASATTPSTFIDVSRPAATAGARAAATIRRGVAFAVAAVAVVRFPNLKSPVQETAAVPAIDRRVPTSPALSTCALGDA